MQRDDRRKPLARPEGSARHAAQVLVHLREIGIDDAIFTARPRDDIACRYRTQVVPDAPVQMRQPRDQIRKHGIARQRRKPGEQGITEAVIVDQNHLGAHELRADRLPLH